MSAIITEEAPLPDIDLLGADGGRLAVAFASGCVTAWGFIKALVYDPRIKELEKDREACHERVSQLEAMLFWHGGAEMRQAMQAALSEERIERIRADQGRAAS